MNVLVRSAAGAALGAALMSVAATPSTAGSSIIVGDVWATPATQSTSSGYAYIRNGGGSGDTLISANAPNVRSIQIIRAGARTVPSPGGTAAPGASAASGPNLPVIANTQVIASAPVPAGGALIFKPGSQHLLLQGITRRWNIGDTFEIHLQFKQAGWIRTTGVVDER
jgi:copper(I)-binding protein